MSDLTLTVKGMAGQDCKEIIRQMCALATQLGVNVEADLNGVRTHARPGTNPADLSAVWNCEMQRNVSFKFASA